MDCSPAGSSLRGISQQEYWRGHSLSSFSRGSFQPGGQVCVLHWPVISLQLSQWGSSPSNYQLTPYKHFHLTMFYKKKSDRFECSWFLLLMKMRYWRERWDASWHSLSAAAAAAKSFQSCLTLCDPIDSSQAPPSLGFSRQEHWSGLPFPSPMHEIGKWKGSRSVVPDS